MSWLTVPLSTATRIVGGGTPSKANGAYWDGNIPWVSPKDMADREIWDTTDHITQEAVSDSATQVVPNGTVLIVVRSGILVRRFPVSIARTAVALNQDMKAFICNTALLSDFLAYYLEARSEQVLSECVKRGATVHSIDMGRLSCLEIPVPAKKEQSRIVELLDEAGRLRHLRREADAKAARILPALFLKMFGDPARNPMDWPEKSLSKLIASVDAGWSARSEARPRRQDEFGVLKVSAVTSGRFRPEEHKAVPAVDESRSIITPKRGDLLFSRANTRELVAASCIVEEDYSQLFLPDKLWRLTPTPGVASSLFLKELFWRDGIRDKFRASSSGSSGSMLNISQNAMLQTRVPAPPFELQMRFQALAWNVMDNLGTLRKAETKLETTWATLLQRAFSGQLTAKWREAHMNELLAEMEQQARLLNLPIAKETLA